MILTGILLSFAAGLLWNISGIVNSTCARKKFDIYSYLLTNVIFSAIFTGMIAAATGNVIFRRESLLFIAVVMLAGIFNTSGALLMQRALQLGHHGIIFLIAQSAPVVPFIAGMLFLGDKPTVQKIGGVMLILLGMFLAALPELCVRRTKDGIPQKKGLLHALFAFGSLGISHTLLALPSLMTLPPGMGKYRTFFLGAEKINECTNTCTQKCSSRAHCCTASLVNNNRNNKCCCHNSKQLLESKYYQLTKFGFIINPID